MLLIPQGTLEYEWPHRAVTFVLPCCSLTGCAFPRPLPHGAPLTSQEVLQKGLKL